MLSEVMAKLKRELNSLQALAILNIAFGGIAMAFGVSIVVPNVLSLMQTRSLLFTELVLAVIGLLAAAISLRWLVSSAEMLDEALAIKEQCSDAAKMIDDEGLTELVVKMVAHYRESKPTVRAMMILSRVAAVCFLINAAFNIATAYINALAGVPQIDVAIPGLGAALSLAVAAAGFAIPHFLERYAEVWDYRLEQSLKAEGEFRKHLGEA